MDSGAEKTLASSQFIYPAQINWLRDGSGILLTLSSSMAFNGQIWEVTYPAGNMERITNDLNYYAGTEVTSDDTTLATTQLSFASSLSVAGGSAGPFSEPRSITSGVGRADGLGGIAWAAPDRILYSYYTSGALRLASVSPKGGEVQDFTGLSGSPMWPSACGKGESFVFAIFDSMGRAVDLVREISTAAVCGRSRRGRWICIPSCSPDGKFVVYQDGSAHVSRLKKISLDGGAAVAIGKESIESPVVSPDSSSVAGAYQSGPDKPARIATVGISSGEIQNIYNLPPGTDIVGETGTKIAWSKDGRSILFLVTSKGTSNLWAQSVATPGKMPSPPRQITNFSSEIIWSFALSPSGDETVFARGRRISDAVLISHFH